MSRPWMPLYVADYLADTGHLSAAQHGAYMLLIMHYWAKGGLPDDDAKLCRIARMERDEWEDSRDTLAEFFKDGWRHERIEKELADAQSAYERRAAAGRKGGSSNAKPDDKQCLSNAQAMLKQSQPQPDISPSLRSGDTRARREAASKSTETLQQFELFWQAWPNKTGKPVALKAFFKVWQETEAILAGVERYIRDKPPDREWLNPATFLNQRRWEDSPALIATARGSPAAKPQKMSAITEAILMMENENGYANTGFDHPAIQQLPSLVDHEPGGFGEQNSLVLRDDDRLQSG